MKDKLFVLILTSALLGGGLLHASFAHSHGHTHSTGESSIWTSLHASLRHEDKKPIFTETEGVMLVLLTVIAMTALNSAVSYRTENAARLRDPYARDALRRGVFRYRTFS